MESENSLKNREGDFTFGLSKLRSSSIEKLKPKRGIKIPKRKFKNLISKAYNLQEGKAKKSERDNLELSLNTSSK